MNEAGQSAVAVSTKCNRCGEQLPLVGRVVSEILDVEVCGKCAEEARRIINSGLSGNLWIEPLN